MANHPLAGNFFVNRHGDWFHNDEKITHERTWKLFSQLLRREDDGTHVVHSDGVRLEIEVEDAPLIVTALRVEPEGMRLRLHDDTYVMLDPNSLVFKGNVPYCDARNGVRARFSTSAYHELAECIEEDGEGGFELVYNDARFKLPPQEGIETAADNVN
ncbi:MAG: DUF1285 domain-containing protein [Deltaproteobacteria bacterium]|nr:DUF1285 domain-containing protein [bacterium]MCB9475873.1 DUF1285 domain-containing protein [Deltaproteobacteria bacterium]MCB9490058.1 DUF1285 domain-containing protein [Deltaproteobacteria bacterium]